MNRWVATRPYPSTSSGPLHGPRTVLAWPWVFGEVACTCARKALLIARGSSPSFDRLATGPVRCSESGVGLASITVDGSTKREESVTKSSFVRITGAQGEEFVTFGISWGALRKRLRSIFVPAAECAKQLNWGRVRKPGLYVLIWFCVSPRLEGRTPPETRLGHSGGGLAKRAQVTRDFPILALGKIGVCHCRDVRVESN